MGSTSSRRLKDAKMSSPLSSVFEPGQKATKSAWVMGDLYHFFATKAEGAPNAIFEVRFTMYNW